MLRLACFFWASVCAAAVLTHATENSGGAAASNYRLRHGDVLQFSMYQEPEMRTETRVQADGTVVLPLVGKVTARGDSLDALQGRLTSLYDERFFVNPQITLQIVSYAPRVVQVIGQVNRPGTVALPGEKSFTLLEAVGAAGGFTRRADVRKVSIRRFAGADEQKLIEIDVDQLLSDPSRHDLPLEEGDIVLVGERWI